MSARDFVLTSAFLSVIIAVGFSPSTWARLPRDPGTSAVARGKSTFLDHCAVCHGERGRGDGPAAGALSPRPTDLSTLRYQHGTFPAGRLTAVIKGTDAVTAHGSPTMLVWGTFFLAQTNGDAAAANRRVDDVVAYLESIQAK